MSTHKGISDPPLPDISWEDAKHEQEEGKKKIYCVEYKRSRVHDLGGTL